MPTAKEKLDKLAEYLLKEEDLRTDLSIKCFEKGNLLGMQIHTAEANMCARLRWTIDEMLNGEGNNYMEFNEAYVLMKRGAKIKLPKWEGYWFWSEEKQTIIIHLKDGNEMDIRETDDVGFTMENICRCDWIEIKE